jgi:hypothetical protein
MIFNTYSSDPARLEGEHLAMIETVRTGKEDGWMDS